MGRQSLDRFLGPLGEYRTLVRVVDAPDVAVPANWTVLLGRGPYPVESERALFAEHDVDVVVTKDSGGALTRAKLDAAADLGLPVVVVARPAAPAGVRTVACVDEAVAWVRMRS